MILFYFIICEFTAEVVGAAVEATVRRSHTSSTNTATATKAYSAVDRVPAFILLHYFVVE